MTATTQVRRDTEIFWAGQFGDDYATRSPGHQDAVAAMLHKVINRRPIHSAIELGAGVGTNLRALWQLNPNIDLAAVEINAQAVTKMPPGVDVFQQSLLSFRPDRRWDLSFTRGVLIHIHPNDLKEAYTVLHHASVRYVLVAEYYNPNPVEIPYRGHSGKLWKRDFAGDMLKQFPDLHLVDYGFCYRGDPLHAQDDISWFLMEKQG